MNFDYTAITAWAAVIAAFASVYALWAEGKRARFAQGIDLLFQLDERFDGEEMRQSRRAAAQSILDRNYSEVDDVLNFFGTVGILTRRGVLDETLV